MSNNLDYFKLMRSFWDWSFENPDIVKPNHGALFAFIVEHCNRLGWKKKFGLPTTMAKEAVGIKSYNTYINTLNDLVDNGFIEMIERSKNQYSANIVALSNFNKSLDKALDKAFIKHVTKQSKSIDSIDKQDTNKPRTKKQVFTPPTLTEVKEYFNEKGYTEESAEKAFNYYDVADWKDSQGNQVKNWKQKMLSVWMKDENKQATEKPKRSPEMQAVFDRAEQAKRNGNYVGNA